MERQIGEVFEYKGTRLEAKLQSSNKLCGGCYFYDKQCWTINDTGECTSFKRSDGKVIFVPVNAK